MRHFVLQNFDIIRGLICHTQVMYSICVVVLSNDIFITFVGLIKYSIILRPMESSHIILSLFLLKDSGLKTNLLH